jgi:hypothetical protein
MEEKKMRIENGMRIDIGMEMGYEYYKALKDELDAKRVCVPKIYY